MHTSLFYFDNEILISNYSTTQEQNNDVYVIREYDNYIKWKGEFILNMNKVEMIITGELLSNNTTPRFILRWPTLQIPKPKENFYYNNIPLININIYDIDNKLYINNVHISDINFNHESFEFSLINLKSIPYNYSFIITISYIM